MSTDPAPSPSTSLTRRTLLGAAASGVVLGAAGRTAPRAAARPARQAISLGDLKVVGVQREQRLNRLWEGYANRSGPLGWAGADGTYSTLLPDGRLLWMFNDTFLGPVAADGAIRQLDPVHNTFVTWRGRPLQTVLGAGSTAAEPLPTAGEAGYDTSWFWNGHGIVEGDQLRVFEYEQIRTGSGHWDFQGVGTSIATFSLTDLTLTDLQPAPDQNGWGVQLVAFEGHTYIYGQQSSPSGKSAHLARAVEGDLLGRWEYWTGAGWSDDPGASAAVADGVGSSYGVSLVEGTWVMATSDSYLGPNIYLHHARTPAGPFTGPVQVYTAPEGLPAADEDADGDVYGPYNLATHPDLSRPGRLVVSYNINSDAITDLWGDIARNRAQFLEITFDH